MLKGYKDSLEKAIPGNWEIGILSDVSEIKFSNVDKITSSDETPVSLCNYLDVYNNEYIDDRIEFMPATATEREIEKFTLKKGDVIITKDSETPDDIAKPAVIVQDLTNVLCGYHLALIRPDSQKVDSVFLGNMLSSKMINHQFERLAQGLTRFGLDVSSIEKALIIVPPLPEQRKIAAILSTVDETIEKTDAIIRETQQLKKGLMQKLFTDGIGHTRFKETEIGRIPEEWSVVKLSEVVELRHGYQFRDYDFTQSGIAVIKIGNLIDGNLYLGDVSFIDANRLPEFDNIIVKNGDLLMSLTGNIGRVVEVKGLGVPVLQNYRVGHFSPRGDRLTKQYLKHALSSDPLTRQMNKFANQTAQANFGKKDLDKLLLSCPASLLEQRKIAEILSEVDAKIETEQVFKAGLEQLKKGLMQVLLTGKVRVKV